MQYSFTGTGSGQQTEQLPDELRTIWIIFLEMHLFNLLHHGTFHCCDTATVFPLQGGAA